MTNLITTDNRATTALYNHNIH